MSAEELESAPSRALWGLQLSAGTVLATTVFGLSLSLISMTALSPDDYRGFENLQPVFELTPWAYMVTGLAAAVGWWLAGGLPRQGVLFRIVGAATGLQAVAHLLTQLATRRGWIEDIGGFYEWYQWV
ncbi:MAG: hypothetical protein KJO07_06455, partial [Deltaproteobacteria bacterium]|nr:hypothetical protein [Deltaproteobacteria bacterium]